MYIAKLAGIASLALYVVGTTYAASPGNADKQFLVMAAKTDMTEAHEGQMAENQANRADVKSFGQTLTQDHTQSYTELTALAAKTGVEIPKGIDIAKDHTIEQLMRLKGNQFDRQFTQDEVAAHRHAIAEYEREEKMTQDPDIKAYAEKMIPVLKKHLQLAEECEKAPKHS